MSSFPRMSLGRAQLIAERFENKIEPYCKKVHIAGSTRRRCSDVGDVEVCCIAKDEFSLGLCFPMGYEGLTLNGSRLKRFIYPDKGIQVELYIVANEADWGRILAIRTGSRDYSHAQLAMTWNRRGWCGTPDGLRRKDECIRKSAWKIKPEYKLCPTLPPVFDTEEKFFAFIGVKWIEPKERDWHFKKDNV